MNDTYKPREYKVTMAPVNGGSERINVKVVAHAATLASYEANRLNPNHIAVETRVLRVIRNK